MDFVLFSLADSREFENILDLLKDMEGMQADLQRDYVKLFNVRDNILEVIEAFPSMQHRLKPDEQIVHTPFFENAFAQIQRGRKGQTSHLQRKLVSKLRKLSSSDFMESSASHFC